MFFKNSLWHNWMYILSFEFSTIFLYIGRWEKTVKRPAKKKIHNTRWFLTMERLISSFPYAIIYMTKLQSVLTTHTSPMQPNTILHYSYNARWHCTLAPLFHLINHAYLSLKPLLGYPLQYIVLDKMLNFKSSFQIFSNEMVLDIDMLWPIMIYWVFGKSHRALVVTRDGHCLLLYIIYILH